MATNETLIGLGVIGLSVAILCGYMAHIGVDVETYPDVELSARAGLDHVCTGPHEYLHPGGHITPVTATPHRYPNSSGGNITALIHHGMTPLSKRAPHDSKWIENPPANVDW